MPAFGWTTTSRRAKGSQQPDGHRDDTPGVAAAPVALAGAIVPGVIKFIVVLSAQTDVFGVGTTVIVGSRLVVASCVTSGWIVPGGGPAGISGVESVKAALLVGGPPGRELHWVVDELPTGGTGDIVPVVLATRNVGMVPKAVDVVAADGIIAFMPRAMDVETLPDALDSIGTDGATMEGGGSAGTVGGGDAGMVEPGISLMNDVAGCADSDRNGAMPLAVVDAEGSAAAADTVDVAETDGSGPVADMDVTGTAGVPGAIWPIGVAQVTNVPGVAGLDANGTGASVVPGVPGWVTAENGPGPLSGEIKIVPGVVGMPMAVVPRVETCAKPALQPHSRIPAVNSKCRICDCFPSHVSLSLSHDAPRPCCLPPDSPSG